MIGMVFSALSLRQHCRALVIWAGSKEALGGKKIFERHNGVRRAAENRV